jgi:pimeloyl-ACP methyl ester carboxylesterase
VYDVDHFQSRDGLRLAYQVDDFTDPWHPSETLILLHSAMSCSARYFAWVPRLSRHYRVARMDFRGHGASEVPAPDHPLSVSHLVSDVMVFMDRIGAKRAHFVGASAGGYVAQRMAMEHPDKVLSLSLYCSTPGFKRSQGTTWLPQIKQKGLRAFLAETITDRFPIGQVDPGLVEWFLDQAGSNNPEHMVRFISMMAQQDWSDEMHRIRCPTLIVIPGLGKIGDNAAYEPMKKNIRDVTVKVYENMPHNVFDIVPDRCVDDLLAFLRAKFGGPASGTRAA